MPGTPFKCKNCNATLTWRDTPVIECEYCHHKFLLEKPAGATVGTGRKRPMRGLFIAVTMLVVVVIVGVVKSRSQAPVKSSQPVAAATPEPASMPAPPPKQEPPPKPALGTKVLEFGEKGTGPGQFQARALAVTPTGEIVVAESDTGRVQVFDATGKYLRVVVLPPDALTKQISIHGAAADSKGRVVVSRTGDLVIVDAAAGTIASTIRGSYPDIYYAGDVEIAQDDTIYAVTDRTGDKAVRKLSPAGKAIGTLTKTYGDHIAVDGAGNLFIAQWETIEVRDAKGEVLRKFSQGPRGKLSRPGAVAFDGKHLFVHDSNSVLIFNPEGAFIGELETGSLNDMAIDRSGALYVLTGDKVRKYEMKLPAGT